MPISSIIYNAPYTYLAKNRHIDRYYLYVVIPYAAGTQVVQTSGNASNEPIAFEVILNGQILTGGYSYFYFNLGTRQDTERRRSNMVGVGSLRALLPAELIDELLGGGQEEERNVAQGDFNEYEETISIEVRNNAFLPHEPNKPSFQTILLLADADEQDGTDLLYVPNVVLPFRPYLYLTNPNAEAGGNEDEYTPRVIIPFDQNSIVGIVESSILENDASDGDGFFIEEVIINTQGNAQAVEPIHTNLIDLYTEKATRVNGYSKFTVNYRNSRYSSKIRNRSSDRSPNSFLSIDQMELKEKVRTEEGRLKKLIEEIKDPKQEQ